MPKMNPELTTLGIRVMGCAQLFVIFAAAVMAALVAAKAKGHRIRALGPSLLAGSLLISALNGLLFMGIDLVQPDPDIQMGIYAAGMGLEVLIAGAFLAGLALLGRAKAQVPV